LPTERLQTRRWPAALFCLALLGLLALNAWQWRDGPPLSANLLQLLPDASHDALEGLATERMQEPLKRDLMLLIRHDDERETWRLTESLAAELRGSGLFAQVRERVQPDLPAVARQLREQSLGLLGDTERRQLIEHPARFVQQRIERLYDPFAASPLPLEQDWFGIAGLALQRLPQLGNVRAESDGSLVAEHAGQRWRVIHARAQGDAFDEGSPQQVVTLVERARDDIEAAGGELLSAGGVLHAAHGQRSARAEASLIGSLSLGATLLLLLWLFRTPRILLAALPVLVGALSGAAACVALFGQMHVLTLVLGASLIGASLDFPLHYLSKSWTLQPWHGRHALGLILPGLALALLTNLIGYLALAFTPFPALTQVAVFSAAGLLGAFLCTTCLLPVLFSGHLTPWPRPLGWAQRWLQLRQALLARIATPWLLAGLGLFCLGGMLQLSFKDDLRQWISRAPELQQQAERIAAITGFQPTSQYFLVRAENADALQTEQRLVGYLALSQLVAPITEQARLHAALPQLLAASQPLAALGAATSNLRAEIEHLQAQPPVTIEAALTGPLGEPWRALWLGAQNDGVAGLISLQGLRDGVAVEHIAEDVPGTTLVDQPARLNQLFTATKLQAGELKLLASLLIFALLCFPFGPGGALRCLAVPLLAALASLASLGWLGQPLTLFGLFGLLLVTAIGVDYAILMREQIGGAAVSLVGTLLAATTTWLSFGLLAVSSTPAVSNFGLTVSLGLVFSFFLAPWAIHQQDTPPQAGRPYGAA
jgi:predicted exporter